MPILCIITFCSLMMIVCCQASYGGTAKKESFLYARLPSQADAHPDLIALKQLYQKRRRFALWSSLFLHIPVFPLCFWYVSILLLYYIFWCIWLIGWYSYAFHESFRDLYRLKRAHGWFVGENLTLIDPSLKPPKRFFNRKQDAVLYDTESPYLADEDRFWLKGYYDNPDDPRLIGPSRPGSPSSSFNMGLRGVKIFCNLICLGVAALLIWLEVTLFLMDFTPFSMTIADDRVKLSASDYPYEFPLSEVENVQLLDTIPIESYSKNNGVDTNQYLLGKFRLKTIGQCRLYYYYGYAPILRVDLKDDTIVFFNSRIDGEVEALYNQLIAGRE